MPAESVRDKFNISMKSNEKMQTYTVPDIHISPSYFDISQRLTRYRGTVVPTNGIHIC